MFSYCTRSITIACKKDDILNHVIVPATASFKKEEFTKIEQSIAETPAEHYRKHAGEVSRQDFVDKGREVQAVAELMLR